MCWLVFVDVSLLTRKSWKQKEKWATFVLLYVLYSTAVLGSHCVRLSCLGEKKNVKLIVSPPLIKYYLHTLFSCGELD